MDPNTSAQDITRCDLCETSVVQMHCDTCLVILCKACVGEHASVDLSKSHKIVDFKNRKSTPLYPGCVTHDKERCKMYCKQCDIPLCNKCIASDKHLGHKLSEMLQVLDDKKDGIIKEQTELNETIYPTYQNIVSDIENRMSQLGKQSEDLFAAITKHGEEWHREIDKIVKKLKAEVDEMKNTHLKTLQKHLDEINQKISEIRNEINSLEDALDSKDSNILFSVKSNADQYKRLPQKINPSLPRFTPGRIQGDELCKLFGVLSSSTLTSDKNGYSLKIKQISAEAGSSRPVKQLLDEPETITTLDTDYKYLHNVACLNDEEIWTSGEGNTMKLFSINQGSVLKSITTKSGSTPFDIEVIKSGDLVYADYWERTVNIVKNEDTKEMIRMQKWKPTELCITSSSDLLVILTSSSVKRKQSKVVRYSGCTEKQSIQFDDKGKPLYSTGSNYKYINENRNQDICVSDWGAGAVVVVNQAGKLRFRYAGHTPTPKNQSLSPRGITTDSESHILTADDNNDCIHIIDQDGQFLCYIDCGLSEPWGLCTDTNDNLFVVQCRYGQVKKIKYQQ